MSAQAGWLERLLDWAVGASREDRLVSRRPDDAEFLDREREPATDDPTLYARNRQEREIELRVLMSTWM